MELNITLPDPTYQIPVMGISDRNLKIIRESLSINITARDNTIRMTGDSEPVGRGAHVLDKLIEAAKHGKPMSREDLLDTIATASRHRHSHATSASEPIAATPSKHHIKRSSSDQLDVYLRGRSIRAATDGQKTYMDAILNHDLTFCVGPAGTGKTYLAVAAAVSMLKHGEVRKLVLVRPAVEAGEKLGFLPGTMQDKVNPYLRPLLDALHDMMEFDHIERFMACDLIEIIPLAFMRGRTLNDALVILDEAQNTTKPQMMMFLTRLGHGSKMIITGDTSQIDLEKPNDSGLIDAIRRLRRVKGVAQVALQPTDIVRHSLVQRIVRAYGQQKPKKSDLNFIEDEDYDNISTDDNFTPNQTDTSQSDFSQ
ncbi:PhoH-like protein [Poriferisphaera corsica]|uniref:PhoH-like protein n=1 Tax=Poriferisphaera corsica TaxID=2528020 RepID=A0A517YUU2_9BACT|nr:PhoH family protein [Poriferisphaera corsica]QDU34009.1 PhoH-like protein [Poriferisphaera corsica]